MKKHNDMIHGNTRERNRGSGRGRLSRVTAALLAAVLLLSGCSLPGFLQRKPTAVSLCKDAVENVQKAGSAAADMDLDMVVSISHDQLNIGMKMEIDADTEMTMTRDPRRAEGTGTIGVSVMGKKQDLQGHFYLDAAEGNETTYLQWNGGNWQKKTAGSGSGSDSEDAGTSAAGGMSPIQTIGIVRAVADQAMRAELLEETVNVNDKEAYQINCTLTGDLVETMLGTAGETAGTGASGSGEEGASGASGLSGIDWTGVEMPAQIYIYKESRLPARITMDCRPVGAQVVQNLVGDGLDQLPVEGIRVDVDSCDVDIVFDRYDEVPPIEIPREALEAEETEELTPGLMDLLDM